MKKTVRYKFEEKDPDWGTRIGQAFNRLICFADELVPLLNLDKEKVKEQSSFNSIIRGDFSEDDVDTICDYAETVVKRARVKYTHEPMSDAPWKDSVLQAAENLELVVNAFREWYAEMLRTSRV